MSTREIVLAGGCFWGTEAYLRRVPGVVATECGYANSQVASPTYDMVCTGVTGAAEAVRVRFDDNIVSLPLLLEAFLNAIDPTSLNRQGHDVGTQYRSGMYWTNPSDEAVVRVVLEAAQAKNVRPVVVEAKALENFAPAEAGHQRYLEKHPSGYCHVDLRSADEFVRRHQSEFRALSGLAMTG